MQLAIKAYSYGHYPIVAGVVLAALGVEGVLAHAGEGEALGWFSAATLFGGCALYLGGHLVFKYRIHSAWSIPRVVALSALLLALPAGAFLPPLAALGGVVLILASLVAVETTRYAHTRQRLRQA